MAMKKSCIFALTSAKGGVGKTTNVLSIAGLLERIGKRVLVIDLDLYTGGVACSLNIDNDKDLFLLVNDMNNNKFDYLENYIIKYDEFIDVLPAPKDPRHASKISAKFLNIILSKAKMKYDVVLVDTNHTLDEHNLMLFDNCDEIIYLLSNDPIDIKNMKSMVSIYKDMGLDNYKIILNNSLIKNKDYFNEYDIKNIIKSKIDFVLPKSLYEPHIDKYVLDGEIMTLNKIYFKKHKKELTSYQEFLEDLIKKGVGK